MQRALLQYFLPKNKPMVEKALIKANRRDLIGFGRDCLITPTERGNPDGRDGRKAPAKKGRNANNDSNTNSRAAQAGKGKRENGKKPVSKRQGRTRKP